MQTETLLAETGFLERLAARLTFGPEDPEDVVQQTWLAALSHPPRDESRARAWLSTVLRNVLRQSRRSRLRRAARELVAARPEATSPADEVRQREETRARVVEAVLALSEPYRTTVLLRYLEELPPRKIAAREGIPVATVKSRIARGLRQLRARLDEEHGGDRRAWVLALLPILGIRRSAEAAGSVSPTPAKVAGYATAAALIVAVVISVIPTRENPGPRTSPAPADLPVLRADATTPPTVPTAGWPPRSSGGFLNALFGRPAGGRVVDAEGRAVPGATVLFAEDPRSPFDQKTAGPDGTFSFLSVVGAGDEEDRLCCACLKGVGASPWVRCGPEAKDLVLTLGPGGVVEGRVSHPETDESVAMARVRVDFGWTDGSSIGFETRTDASGRYRIAGVPTGTWLLPSVRSDERSLSYFGPQRHDYRGQDRARLRDEMVEAGQAKVLGATDRRFVRDLPARRIRGVEATLLLMPPPGGSVPEKVLLCRGWRWPYAWSEHREEVRPGPGGTIACFLPEGRVSLRVEAGNLYGIVPLRTIEDDGPPESITVALAPRPRIRARLVDDEGSPVRRRGIEVSVMMGFGGGTRGGRVRTDSSGEIVITDRIRPTTAGYADESRLVLTAKVPGYLEPNRMFPNRSIPLAELEALPRNEEREIVIDIPVFRSLRVPFTVVDPDGEPVPGVRLRPKDPERFTEAEWTSDGRGEVEVGLRRMPKPHQGGFGLIAHHPYKAKHHDVGSFLIGEARGRIGREDFKITVWRWRPVRVTVLATDGTVLANRTVTCHRREFETDAEGGFTIELLDYTTSVTVRAKGYYRGNARREDGRATVRLRPARTITVRVVAPPEVKDENIEVSATIPGHGGRYSVGRPGRGGTPRSLELSYPADKEVVVRARTGDRMHDGEASVPEGAEAVTVVLRPRSLEPTRLRFLHPDGTPATDTVIRFSLAADTEFSRENLKPDENGIITLDLPPGPNHWSWEPRMAGHRRVGSAPRFTVPSADPIDIVMERAVTVSLALDGQAEGIRIEPRDLKVSITGAKGKVDFDKTTNGFDDRLVFLVLTFRDGPATIRVEYAGKTYTYEHEKVRLEPVKIRLR